MKVNTFFAILVIAVLVTAGCSATSQLTRKELDLRRAQEQKCAQELTFLSAIVLPEYGLTSATEPILLNTKEFWTGKDPLRSRRNAPQIKVATIDDLNVVVTHLDEPELVRIDFSQAADSVCAFVLERTDSGVLAKDVLGNVLYRAHTDEDGSISVFDKEQKLIKHFSPRQVSTGKVSMAERRPLIKMQAQTLPQVKVATQTKPLRRP